jgi:hypothetical protein
MSDGQALYLALAIIAFLVFALVLFGSAWYERLGDPSEMTLKQSHRTKAPERIPAAPIQDLAA